MKRTTLLAAGLLATLLPSASFADCSDTTAKCFGIKDDGTKQEVGGFTVNQKWAWDKMKCQPCANGCGHTVNRAFDDCKRRAQEWGFSNGELQGYGGFSVEHAIDKTLEYADQTGNVVGKFRKN